MPLGPQNIDLAESYRRLSQGGLPTRALMRLAEEAGPNKRLFTSDLTINEFLLTEEISLVPISQVMGTSVFHIGRIADYKGATGEIGTISEAHRAARQLAVHRLFQEAQTVGADAVVGVRLGERLITKGAHGKGGDDGDEVIEFTVVGTAVRADWLEHPRGQPVVTDLSGQDLWALAKDGYEPCGLVFDFCRYHVFHVLKEWSPGGEVSLAVDGVAKARHMVADRVVQHARQFGAEFVVGSDITVTVQEVPCGYPGCHNNDLDIDVAWFGTGIRRHAQAQRPAQANVPPLILAMMPLGKKKRAAELDEGEDESAELAREAKEEEERAAEKDEGGSSE